ncbi:MAG: hypothetical protein ACOZB3_07915 [Calditrichota bacterium]
MHVEVPRVPWKDLSSSEKTESSSTIRRRVESARRIQWDRFAQTRSDLYCNAQMVSREIERFAPLESASLEILHQAIERMGLSARAYHRIRKIARTIADLEGSEDIQLPHVVEAIQYRSLDRIKDAAV